MYYFFLQSDIAQASNAVVHEDLGFSLGMYLFFSESSFFRMGARIGGGVITTVLPVRDLPVYTDFYIDPVKLFIELNLRHYAFFTEFGVRYAFGTGNSLLERGFVSAGNIDATVSLGVMKKW